MLFCSKQILVSETNFGYYFCILCGGSLAFQAHCSVTQAHAPSYAVVTAVPISRPLSPSPPKIPFPLNYLSALSNPPGSLSSAPGTTDVLSSSVNFTIGGASYKWNRCKMPLSFCVCFSLAQSLRFTYVVPLILEAEQQYIVCIYRILFVHSSVNGRVGCLHLLAIVNDAAMNMGIQIFVLVPAFNSSRFIPRSGNTGLHGSSIFNTLGTTIPFSTVAPFICLQATHKRF